MGMLRKFSTSHSAQKLKRIMNWYGPYLGAGVKIEYLADDWRELRVAMSMKWYNRNAVGTHFGGSLYSMIDPHYMLMLMKILGNDYIVWDKAASINFIKPGTGTVRSTMKITDEMLVKIQQETQHGEKYLPNFEVEIFNQKNELVAQAVKTLYIKRKPPIPGENSV
ncbi:acyl-coenzyme A thioesterase PaaI-like protein [Marinicella litoralis]|uniref:Acyl-coenzyme A thioesterase PaaI-like protein n=2 Tax=Marinicella litoralis TaxID=644220 RepID=A0A4R6Y2R0_9GAMM|nr:acyl-coenzyme A thioesterase PaaI-like protein [Marinicella litoralis]